MEDNPFLNGLITLAVGIILVIFTRRYNKMNEEKEKIKITLKESQRKILEKLKEIVFTLETAISADYPNYKRIQNECLIFSNQLTSILGQISQDIPEEIVVNLKELSSDFTRLGNFRLYHGCNFLEDCKSITETIQKIIREIENLNN